MEICPGCGDGMILPSEIHIPADRPLEEPTSKNQSHVSQRTPAPFRKSEAQALFFHAVE